ncbi:MAG: hypothetical protein M1829_000368 [Trizodia sp. TS-e1964]|nr:MAG: hypothetical protein M1829_000368 [Trizodia sp. TS-e1964]
MPNPTANPPEDRPARLFSFPTKKGPSPSTTNPPPSIKKSLPSGIVLGRDGKPCRTCSSFAAWATLQSQTPKPSSSATNTNTNTSTAPPLPPPPTSEALGASSWTLLHSLSATYPRRAPAALQAEMSSFLALFAKLYPCWVCGADFAAYMARERVRVGGRAELALWMCGAHNEVNRKLGKAEFDCARVEERWGGGEDEDGQGEGEGERS